MFGSSTPGFGVPSGSSPFGSSSIFGQNNNSAPSSDLFGTNSSAFGPKPSVPAFGSGFGAFGSSSGFNQNSSSTSSGALAFGGTSTGVFGTSNPTFGSKSSFGAPSNTAFGSPVPTFGAPSNTAFGSPIPTFGTPQPPALGFGALGSSSGFNQNSSSTSGASVFGGTSTGVFGTSSPSFGSKSSFGSPSNTAFGSPLPTSGALPPPAFGINSTTQSNGSTSFGPSTFFNQPRGSRNVAYTSTAAVEDTGKVISISSMPAYKEKCHEELRWEDYHSGDKAQSAGQMGIGGSTAQSNPFSTSSSTPTNPFLLITPSTSYPSQSSSNPFAQVNSSNMAQPSTSLNSPNLFAQKSTPNPFAPVSSPNPFSGSSSSPFAPKSSSNPLAPNGSSSPFAPSSSAPFSPNASSNPFSPSSPFAPISSPEPFPGSSSSPFAPKSSSGPLSNNGFLNPFPPKSSSPFAPNNSSNIFSPPNPSLVTPSTSNNLFAPKSSFPLPSSSNPFAPNLTLPTSSPQPGEYSSPSPTVTSTTTVPESTSSLGPSSFTNFLKTTPNPVSPIFSSSLAPSSSGFCPGVSPISTQSSGLSTSVGMASPYGTLPAMPELTIGHRGSTPIKYGISSLPVLDKPATPTRLSPLISSHHLSQRRTRLPVRKYDPNSDCPKKVPFYCSEEHTHTATDVEPRLFPRENPRALVINPSASLLQRPIINKKTPVNIYENDEIDKNSSLCKESKEITGNRTSEADEVAVEEGQEINIEALLPKLRLSDYYTEPTIQELAVKERAEPGFSRRVNNFVVGRQGYGSIKFLGETNVEKLELDSIVQFNCREVLVYADEDTKPPVGEGLNKAAEVTLLNIKCVGKKTGKQYVDGPMVDEYKQRLIKKATEQGAEFVSYDPVLGEWKFSVRHFS